MKLSVVIPAHNEEACIVDTVKNLSHTLIGENIHHEIVVVDDHSSDRTALLLNDLSLGSALKITKNALASGYGNAVRSGIEESSGDCIAIMMADLSDDPSDLVRFYRTMQDKHVDCVFGSRFIKGGKIDGYPKFKLILNRIANLLVKFVFRIPYNDCTNAFKLYHRDAINGIQPLLSPHFNLTLEMPLKAIVRGYSYIVLPNSWRKRQTGKSKLRLKEMGSRYFFIFLYCLIEKYFSKNDYTKPK